MPFWTSKEMATMDQVRKGVPPKVQGAVGLAPEWAMWNIERILEEFPWNLENSACISVGGIQNSSGNSDGFLIAHFGHR